MSEPHSARPSDKDDKPSLLQRVLEFINPGPNTTEELVAAMAEAEDDDVINADTRVLLERVLRMAEMTASDVMVPAPRMDLLDIDAPIDELVLQVIRTAHSRFPVFQGERDNIVGVLLAKDLLKLSRSPSLNIRTMVRPALFVPESKGLNDLSREFRLSRSHMAIVIDEFGRIAGLVTFEDVIEQIVGEIEDEFDEPEEEGDIFGLADHTYRVSGDTPVDRVAEAFEVRLASSDPDESFDTIGGLIAHELGRVPRKGEHFDIGGLRFLVLHTKGGAVRWFKVSPHDATPDDA
ncbi:CBS domain-containing protein [Diaphorobacter ruginosibacter]|uniref:CBS domain-containing protein n=1 Tax=Diaphorobacter ruginosibacter TaxID=1715720 RepID=A0A7G9RQD8_9BURK|nr:transporter associated domain-containing protein [Diaphorobacter ruginosibacter]QNN57813.1 CBS domain-containing protein [Diaphorobacter ruginosibacter]